MSTLAPILALVGIVWYVVAAWRDQQHFLAFAALLMVGLGVATAMGKLQGDYLRYATIASGVCGLLLLVGAIFHWRKLLLPWLLIIAANVMVFASGAEAPWMEDFRKPGPSAPRQAPR